MADATIEAVALLVVLLGLVASMPAFATMARDDGEVERIHGQRSSFVVGPFLVGWFYWLIRPAARAARSLGMGPLAFNLAGLFLGCLAGVLFGFHRAALAGWAVLLGGIADILDGYLARTLGVADARGAFIDSSLDRFSETAVFVGLAVYVGDSVWAQPLVASSLGGSLLVSYARARGESLGVVCRGGLMQRPERVLLVGFASILDPALTPGAGGQAGRLLLGALALMAVGTLATAVYRTLWIADQLRSRSD